MKRILNFFGGLPPEAPTLALSENVDLESRKPKDELRAELKVLRAERDGYKTAYETLSAQLGTLRIQAAPYLRPKDAVVKRGPSIFVATLPKSGTVYIGQSLKQTLDFDFTSTLVTPTFPKNIVWPSMARDFACGGMISLSHMQPDDENFAKIKSAGITKGVLHIRDPRAALNSWYHFMLRRLREGRKDMPLPSNFAMLSQAEQIDELICSYYEPAVSWISDWLKRLDNDPTLNFMIMTHEKLAKEPEEYIFEILTFYDLSASVWLSPKTEGTHFRTGNNDDWRSTLTPEQTARVTKMIPPKLWDRFGWPR